MKSLVVRFFLNAFLGLVVLLLLLVVILLGRASWVFRDRFPGYGVDVHRSTTNAAPLRAGFGRVNITPAVGGTNPPVWIAGFDQGRAATGVHDDLFAVATVVDDGHTRLGIVAIDSIGFFHDDVVRVRQRLSPELKLDYVVVCATHNHSTPDLMGLWGPDPLHSGVNPEYRDRVIAASASALEAAVSSLQPATLSLLEIPVSPAGLVADTRKPEVFDPNLRLMLFRQPGTGGMIGSLVGWANHPETPWSGNTELTSDFCGIIRDGLERGVVYGGEVKQKGLGGIHVFVNGAVGGLMTTHPSTTVRDPFLQQDFSKPSHDKTRALGNYLVKLILDSVAAGTGPAATVVPISVQAQTVHVPLENRGFLLAGLLGLLERGHSHWMQFRSEVAYIGIGDASIACIPGEIYPELVNGGVVKAPGGDFDIEPLEIPPIRDLMPGKVKFLFGLANDEIGYIIPKSEWDQRPPYLFGADHAPYGEVNSVGPNTAYVLHSALRELIHQAGPQ